MVSIDEAYLDMTGTERLHGPPMRAAQALHDAMKQETNLNCSIGIGTSRLVAKICSDQAKPNGSMLVIPGREQEFLAPLDVRKIPGVGKVTEKKLNDLGIKTVGDLAGREEAWLKEVLGDWALTLAGKAHGLDAGAWFQGESAMRKTRSRSATNTRSTKIPGTRRSWRRCWRGYRRWSAGDSARADCMRDEYN